MLFDYYWFFFASIAIAIDVNPRVRARLVYPLNGWLIDKPHDVIAARRAASTNSTVKKSNTE